MPKIEGEVFDIEKKEEEEIVKTDDETNEKYRKGEMRIITEQARYPVKSIKGLLDDTDDYKLNPVYQRRKRWDIGRKSRLMESFIMNVPLPPIFLYEYSIAKYEVMDGQQRLTSIYDFYSDNFALEGLEYWKELNGKRYSELPSEIQKGIDRRYLSSIVLLEETAKTEKEAEELKQIVFERLNSGGEKLEPQETRNALYNGKMNQLCLELAKNDKFRKMWKIPLETESEKILLANESYRKMEDVELVLRFFAYRHLEKLSGYTVEDFLDEYLKKANDYPDETIEELKILFINSIDVVYELFGERAFMLPELDKKAYKPVKTVYDPLMQSIAKNIVYKEKFLENKQDINENRFKNKDILVNEKGKRVFDGRYNAWTEIKNRMEYFDKLFEEYIK